MLEIISLMNKSADILNDKPLIKKVRSFLLHIAGQDPHDISFISYANWLKRKFQIS
jgi:hypothetical protein